MLDMVQEGTGGTNLPIARDGIPPLRLRLLGGFQVERDEKIVPGSIWQRRQAKSLVKLLAAESRHALHREQVIEHLWPDVELDSALNSFAKALHAARKALEPELAPRGVSAYLNLTNDVLTLSTEHVWIDADHFQEVGEAALKGGEPAALDAALQLWTGELLPEDRYELWATLRRESLGGLRLRLLLALAQALEQRGEYDSVVMRLLEILQEDPLREDVHRRLMRLYAEGGNRHQAVSQYHTCTSILDQELDTEPEPETTELYQAIFDGQVRSRPKAAAASDAITLPPAVKPVPATPLAGRSRVLQLLSEQLEQAKAGHGNTILISGEVGVGKTRMAAELARLAARQRMLVLWGASYEQENVVPYGPFAEALQAYLATRPAAECEKVAARFPLLGGLIPSIRVPSEPLLAVGAEAARRQQFADIVRLLTDLSSTQPVVLVLDDLHMASRNTLQLMEYLCRLAPQRPWVIVGTYREHELLAGGDLQRMFMATTREGLCTHVNLRRLARQDSDHLVDALLPDAPPSVALLEKVYALTLGNPLFIHELVGAMRGRHEIALAHGRWDIANDSTSVPRQVQKLVDGRIDRLSVDVQHILTLVATAGPEVRFAELAVAAAEVYSPPPLETAVLDVLEQARRLGILREHGDGYAFEHPLVRAALYENISRPRRCRLHTALARTLEASRPDAVELVNHHYRLSSEPHRTLTHLRQGQIDRAS